MALEADRRTAYDARGRPAGTRLGLAEPEPKRPDLEALADRAPDIIYRYRLRPTRGLEYVNAAAERILGYTPEEHYADPDLGQKLVHPDDRPILDTLLEAGPTTPLFLRWRRKDGTLIWMESRHTPVYDDAGELVAIEGIARQIDDPTRTREETIRLIDGLRMTLAAQRVFVDGELVHLTPSEFRLLALLTAHPGKVISREQIMRHLWHSEYVGNRHTCETHISTLRSKIERDPRFPRRILTVRGRGYRFAVGSLHSPAPPRLAAAEARASTNRST